MTRFIILVRHGATSAGDGQRFIGHTDHSLSAQGEQQALALRRALDACPLAVAYCSDLARSRQTARIVLGDRDTPLIPRRDLREIAMGAWEGRLRREIAAECPEDYAARGQDLANHKIPGGESFGECSARVAAAFHEIVTPSQGNILIVGHAGTNRALLCHLLGMPLANLFRLGQDHGCMNVIGQDESGFRVLSVNGKENPVVNAEGGHQ